MSVPVKILTGRFGKFLAECKKHEEDLLKGNSTELWEEILSGFCHTEGLKRSLEGYSVWMDQSWVRELILNALTDHKDNYAGAETYVPMWMCETTYRIYKLFCILAPVGIYDNETRIIAYARYKKVVYGKICYKYFNKHWNALIQLYEEGKLITTAELSLFKFDFGSIEEYQSRISIRQKLDNSGIDTTEEESRQMPTSSSNIKETPSTASDSSSLAPKPLSCKRTAMALFASPSTSAKKFCSSTNKCSDSSTVSSEKLTASTEGIAPMKILRKRFGELLEKLQNHKEDLLKGNRHLWKGILIGFCDTLHQSREVDQYVIWMDQSWVRELILNGLNLYKDNYGNAEAYVPIWTCERTYRVFKIFSVLAPIYVYDNKNNIVEYARSKKIFSTNGSSVGPTIYKHWDILTELMEEGKLIPADQLNLYTFDFGSAVEYEARIITRQKVPDTTKNMSIRIPSSVATDPPSAGPTFKLEAAGSSRQSTASTSSRFETSQSSSTSDKTNDVIDLTLEDSDSDEPATAAPSTSSNNTKNNVLEVEKEPTAESSTVSVTPSVLLEVVDAVKNLPLDTQNIVILHILKGSKR